MCYRVKNSNDRLSIKIQLFAIFAYKLTNELHGAQSYLRS